MSSDDDEMTDDEFPRQDGWMSMSSELLLQHILDVLAFRARAAGVVMQQQPPLAFPRQDGWMSSDDDEMTDEFPRQDQDGWMSSEDEEMTDEFTGKRNRLQLRRTY